MRWRRSQRKQQKNALQTVAKKADSSTLRRSTSSRLCQSNRSHRRGRPNSAQPCTRDGHTPVYTSRPGAGVPLTLLLVNTTAHGTCPSRHPLCLLLSLHRARHGSQYHYVAHRPPNTCTKRTPYHQYTHPRHLVTDTQPHYSSQPSSLSPAHCQSCTEPQTYTGAHHQYAFTKSDHATHAWAHHVRTLIRPDDATLLIADTLTNTR